jgi:hypothetical protein
LLATLKLTNVMWAFTHTLHGGEVGARGRSNGIIGTRVSVVQGRGRLLGTLETLETLDC